MAPEPTGARLDAQHVVVAVHHGVAHDHVPAGVHIDAIGVGRVRELIYLHTVDDDVGAELEMQVPKRAVAHSEVGDADVVCPNKVETTRTARTRNFPARCIAGWMKAIGAGFGGIATKTVRLSWVSPRSGYVCECVLEEEVEGMCTPK